MDKATSAASEQDRTMLAMQFRDMEQQREASEVGMWIFLATEVMFFGGMFAAFSIYHHLYGEAFTLASHHMDFWIGSVNTGVLLVSSLFMALGVHAAKEGRRGALLTFLTITMLLGMTFLSLKGLEYANHIHEHLLPGPDFHFEPRFQGGAELYYFLYFAMTGLHALHMIIGISVLAGLWFFTWRRKYNAYYHNPVVIAGLYWHFVDVIWIFLFPMFYLIGGHG